MIGVSMDVTEAIVVLKTKQNITTKLTKEALAKSAIFLQGEIKQSIAGNRAETTSVDTGQFLNSVDLFVLDNRAYVWSLVDHAKFMEYGTSHIHPRMHFRNSLFRNKENIRIIFSDSINKL